MLLFFPDESMADDTQELPLEPAGGRGAESPKPAAFSPLAARMRPRALSEVVGHANILGEGCLLPRLVAADNFGSLIFYGPPGCGKTTLANVIAAQTRSRFVKINAVLSNAAQLRDELAAARYRRGERTILFVDEIHRFNKAQQDLLLPDVEEGNVRLIGATTQNPGFFVNAPLLSRSHLFRLEPLGADDVAKVLRRALDDCERGMGNFGCRASDEILKAVAEMCDGDMRRALNALETMVLAAGGGAELSRADVEAFAKERRIRYDSGGDEHYDLMSAFQKSMRGSDPDATVHYLGRLLEAGVRLSVASNGVDVHSGRPLDLPEVSGAGSVLSLRKSFACLQAGNGLAPIQSFFPEGDSSLLCVLVSRSLREDLAWEFAQRAGQREWVHITPCLEVPEEQPRLGAVHRFYWEV